MGDILFLTLVIVPLGVLGAVLTAVNQNYKRGRRG